MIQGMNSSMIYLIYCKYFCKCHNVPLPSTTINKYIKYKKQTKTTKVTFKTIVFQKSNKDKEPFNYKK
jgi:hypothetical protein